MNKFTGKDLTKTIIIDEKIKDLIIALGNDSLRFDARYALVEDFVNLVLDVSNYDGSERGNND